MRLDQDRLVLWGLGALGGVLVSLGSGLALANFTVAGTSQFYMPQGADSALASSDDAGDRQSSSGLHEWLPSYTSVSQRSAGLVAGAQGEGSSYD